MMEKFVIKGGTTLSGRVNVSGSKNSSLPIMAATLLTKETCVIRRVPDVSDTNYMIQILQNLGAEVERASGTVIVRCEKVSDTAPYELVRKMRASICVMGPLMARLGHTVVSLPGGCVIGDRPVDLHLRGMEALGAVVKVEKGNMHISAPNGLHGTTIDMMGKHGTTVLGTDNVMMAAALAEGTTIIENAAGEPEVEDLADFLNKMGAKITGAGTNTITVEGVKELGGVEHTVIPDRIEAGTFLVAGAIAGNGVTLRRVRKDHLKSVIQVLEASGYHLTSTGSDLTIKSNGSATACDILTEPYPGFPTDMQAQFCALFSTTPGSQSLVTEQIFPQRFMHIAELKRMGADIDLVDDTARIRGVEQLSAAPVMASDLRASAALVLAALRAEGETEINRVYHIDRGYEHIDEKLMDLGADIRRLPA